MLTLIGQAKIMQRHVTITPRDWARLTPVSRDAWYMAWLQLRAEEADDTLLRHRDPDLWAGARWKPLVGDKRLLEVVVRGGNEYFQ